MKTTKTTAEDMKRKNRKRTEEVDDTKIPFRFWGKLFRVIGYFNLSFTVLYSRNGRAALPYCYSLEVFTASKSETVNIRFCGSLLVE
ncbi:hypothetical protein RUM44_005854 [Polyplax serrata]|uniref:Uncharacterized protein n=1 Tax=Polyplax serrata TaxID=468196 RepID=A0ABR1AY94_POLSC